MTELQDLQTSVRDTAAFNTLVDYREICREYLGLLEKDKFTRIISPSAANYMFYQYDEEYRFRITRPLNSNLFFTSCDVFEQAFTRFMTFLSDLRQFQEKAAEQPGRDTYIASSEINKVIYTMQQTIGAISDSFDNPNQARKRIGQLFERLIRLIIAEIGIECEPRTINIAIPGFPGYQMSYELDVVFSRNKAIVTTATTHIHSNEIVGSVKTTSKDRIDKIFLDKYLLSKLLERPIPVVAIFLHDVQRAAMKISENGTSIFGVNSTFKRNHFLGYTVAFNKLDGVYYVDPRPEMRKNQLLREEISDFQHFLVTDLWRLTDRHNEDSVQNTHS